MTSLLEKSSRGLKPRIFSSLYAGLKASSTVPGGAEPGLTTGAYNVSVRKIAAVAFLLTFFVASANAVRELVVIEALQPAQRVEGVVLDPAGAPIADMTVADCAPEWGGALRRTTTHSSGHFRFS